MTRVFNTISLKAFFQQMHSQDQNGNASLNVTNFYSI